MDANGFDGIARSVAGARTRRSLLKGIMAGLAVVATGKIGMNEVSAAGGNEQLVVDYYDALQKHTWTKAYDLLGEKFHQSQSLHDFIAGFAETVFTSVEIGQVALLPSNRTKVNVVVNAWLHDGTPQQFTGSYLVGQEGGVAKIVDADLEVVDSPALSPLCHAGQLSTSVSDTAGMGHRYSDITVTNTGDVCTVAGMPSVSIKDSHGATLIKGRRATGWPMSAIELVGGDSAVLSLDWTNWCGASVSGAVRAAIRLPGSTGHFSVANVIGVPPCIGGNGSSSTLQIKPWQPA